MGKYRNHEYHQIKERKWEVHPVWRGIGCMMLILIPIMAWAAAMLLVRENTANGWVEIPRELQGWVNFAPIYQRLPGLKSLLTALPRIYYVDILATFGFLLVGFGLFTVLYSFLYQLAGGGRKSPLDAEPIRRSPRRGLNRSR